MPISRVTHYYPQQDSVNPAVQDWLDELAPPPVGAQITVKIVEKWTLKSLTQLEAAYLGVVPLRDSTFVRHDNTSHILRAKMVYDWTRAAADDK